jgi:beta-glucosidase/6-phospho-beta-glucosidase/beta-galactosidase
MAMMRSTGVLAMGTGDRPPATEPVEEEQGGIGGYDPTRYRMGIVAADLEQMARAHRLAAQAIKSTDGSIRVGWTLALVDLVAVDRQTFVRSVKPSARWLGQVAQRNGLV